jgi:N-methylhydantoinase A
MPLRKDLAEKAIKEKVADRLGIGTVEAAAAIYKIINSAMADGTRQTFTRKGMIHVISPSAPLEPHARHTP